MTLGALAVELLPLKKGNIVLTYYFYLALACAGEEEGEEECKIQKVLFIDKKLLKIPKNFLHYVLFS
jgi:hypothetical protein